MTEAGDEESKEKSALETDKLALEKRLLERQLSVPGLMMAWLQAASVPVALLGAILAFFVGFGQLRQGAENQAADRFDKALTRLASKRQDERMTGVSGLQLFLSDSDQLLQKQALQFLINALSLEKDVRVHGAILDVLADLSPGRPSQDALDAGLRIAVERDRSLTKSIVDASSQSIAQRRGATLTKLNIVVDPNTTYERVIADLTTDQYLALLNVEQYPFAQLNPSEDLPMTGLRTVIQTLLAHGATSHDFKQINCEECDFRTAKSLDAAVFDEAYLRGADFTGVSLRGASFKDADLGGTNFFRADLSKADLRLRRSFLRPSGHFVRNFFSEVPLLECANLGGANLSGQPLIIFNKYFDTSSASNPSYTIGMPRMVSVQLDSSTKLNSFRILTEIQITDDYLKQHPAAPEVRLITAKRGDLWDSPLFKEPAVWNFWRLSNATNAVTDLPGVDDDTIKDLGGEASLLQGFVDQPKLRALPLYSRFVDAINALNATENNAARVAQVLTDRLAVNWATVKRLPCTERVPAVDLLMTLDSQ
jgi:uncharacterized protein YjbI with pentapeptide repeats